MPFYDALDAADLKHILVRHEQGAAFAASGYARMKNQPGVCVATSGPGATNLITGITDAAMDGIPLFVITGQVASPMLGTDAFQEAPIPDMVRPVVKYCKQVTSPEQLLTALPEAWKTATTGRPGPVLIDITKDAQINQTDAAPNWTTLEKESVALPTEDLTAATELLAAAKQPLILFGHGVHIAGASTELAALMDKSSIPATATLHGLSSLATTHPNYLGMAGMHGHLAANAAIQDADVILAVGMRFDDRLTGRVPDFAPNAKIIHVDIDNRQIGKVVPPTIGINHDAKAVLAALVEAVPALETTAWLEALAAHREEEKAIVISEALKATNDRPNMSFTLDALGSNREQAAIFISDVGQHQMSAARYLDLRSNDRLLNSGGLGTMGFALPAAVGAAVANQDTERAVVAIIGDGSFQMSMQELGTIAQEKLPVKILILNNNYLGMVRQWQELFFARRYSHVDISSPDLAQIAAAYNIPYLRAEQTGEVGDALAAFWAATGPVLLEVAVTKEENIFPIVPSGASLSEVKLTA